MAEKLSIAIALDGASDIVKQFDALGKAGTAAFKQIQDAAKQPIVDQAQLDQTKRAFDQLAVTSRQLGTSFNGLADAAQQFGTEGQQAAQQVSNSLQQTNQAAQKTQEGLFSTATKFKILASSIIGTISGITGALVKGAAQTGKTVSDQADELGITVEQWQQLRKQIIATNGSQDDFVEGVGKLKGKLDEAKTAVAGVTKEVVSFGDSSVTVFRFNKAAEDASEKAKQTAAALQKLGISARSIASADVLAAMTEAAQKIDRMAFAGQKAAAGTALFGDNWKDVIAALVKGKKAVDDVGDSFVEQGKLSRTLTTEQIEQGKELSKKWEELKIAFRSLRDEIGALLVPSQITKAQWLINLIDGVHQLFIEFSKLSALEVPAFLAKLGTSAPEQIFKTLVALGQQLGGIWTGVLVPAGRQLLNVISSISAALGGIPETQVAAFFITAAAAALGLAIALKAISLALTPLSLLLSLFSPFGAILIATAAAAIIFWDKFKAGAEAALAVVPQGAKLIQESLQRLFAGDFSGAWAKFSEGAIIAFGEINDAIVKSEGIFADFFRAITGQGKVQIPWIKDLVDGIAQIGKDLPATIGVLVSLFLTLGQAAQSVANIINRVFGTELTGTSIALIAIIGTMTGAFAGLAAIATTIGVTFTVLSGTIAALAGVFGAIPVAIGLATAAAAAFIALNWDSVVAAWNSIVTAIGNATTAITTFSQQIATIAWDTISNLGVAAWNAVTAAIQNTINKLLQFIGLRPSEPAAPPSGDGGSTEFAGGGIVRGRGTGISDSNLAWVSRGEHIMPAAAVAQPGVLAFLEALRRSGGDLQRVLDNMGRFALGGLIMPRIVPAFATGGLVGGSNMHPVTIHFPGVPPIGGLRASADTVAELQRAAAMAQVRSGGRKPSRYS